MCPRQNIRQFLVKSQHLEQEDVQNDMEKIAWNFTLMSVYEKHRDLVGANFSYAGERES